MSELCAGMREKLDALSLDIEDLLAKEPAE